jgi:predicted nucleic acid-binding protein
MKFIINASPIIFLAKIELIQYLPELFEDIIIPDGVFNEVLAHDDEASRWIKNHGKQYISVLDQIPVNIHAWDLGRGETEVIASALNLKNCAVGLDDQAARNCALSYRLKIIGTIGLILRAQKIEVIKDGEPYLNKLIKSGYRISESVLQHALFLMRKR